MPQSLKNLTIGLSGVAIATLCSTGLAPSASAFTFSNNNSTVGVDAADIGKNFTIGFNGNVATENVASLSSRANFKFLGFSPTSTSVTSTTTTGKGKNAVTTTITTTLVQTIARFEVILKNTSDAAFGSRVSALGFNTDKVEVAAKTEAVSPLPGATKLFAGGVINGSLPNTFGNIDVCYTDGSTCQGGQNGGVSNQAALPGTFQKGSFIASLTMNGAVNSFSMSNFGVRYQSITGTSGGKTFKGASGTGRGTLFIPPITPPRVRRVPEPATIGGLVFTGLVALRMRKKRQQEAREA
jgi:hypothetical protein